MSYPLKEQVFVEKYLAGVDEPDGTDREFAEALVRAINKAYYAGLQDGRKETR